MKDLGASVGFCLLAILALLVALYASSEKLKDHEQRIKALETNRVVIYGPWTQSEHGRVNISGGGMITNYGFEMKR